MPHMYETFTPVLMDDAGSVHVGSGALGGFFCTSAGTVKLYDGTDNTGTVIVDEFTVAPSVFYPLPFAFAVGLYYEGDAIGTFGTVSP